MACFVIAEAGVNHNGDEALALRLVDAAAQCGADAVKFQTFTAERLAARGAAKAAYQVARTGQGDQVEMLKRLELVPEAYARLRDRAAEHGIEFLSTPFDELAADMLVGLGMKRIKVPSGELTNFPLLRHLAAKNLPMLLSTGMATLDEVGEAVDVVRRARAEFGLGEPLAERLTLLQCTSCYPARAEDVNLRAMWTLRERFGLPVGFSDHTEGLLAAVAAAAAGAAVIEKHFTLDRELPGPDHQASLQPGEFAAMVEQIRAVETLLGSEQKRPCVAELAVREVVRRSVTLARPVRAGATIKREDLVLLRPGTGIAPKYLDVVVGRRAVRDLPAGATLRWGDLVS
jgi:N,N'-diacetyllegionaminate synthase